ncbi:RagB/SusD family nutrient uptake outer membrane protein [Ekhidna sp.]|uniref:RagB/SusD family nutrient uptake outer membrane protein n=1 Tax=Ekhidna sp. TaxID=2608089 RepID=UPI0032EEC650
MNKILILLITICLFSCEDILETEVPASDIPADQAIQSEEDLQDLLNSSYDVLANYKNGLNQRIADILSDDLDGSLITGFLLEVYNHNTNIFNEDVQGFYKEPYFMIHRSNLLIEEIDRIDMAESDRLRMIAEARFLRGVAHFDAVNLMAHLPGYSNDNSHLGVPLRFTTGAQPVNRSSVNETYNAIIADLRFAAANLPDNNGVYATSFAANGFLAKVYFQELNYDSAIYFVNQVLDNGSPYFLTNNINARYSQNITSEHIFYTLSNNAGDDNRSDVFTGSYRSDVQNPFLRVSQDLYELGTVNALDDRSEWFEVVTREDGSEFYVTTKFNSNYFNVALIHVVDMLLLRAEALTMLGTDLDQARDDLNQVRNRAGLVNISPAVSQAQLLDAIQNERRIEMSFEGDRILQLKRRGAEGEDILIRGDEWNCNGMILLFPNEEQFQGFQNNPGGGC